MWTASGEIRQREMRELGNEICVHRAANTTKESTAELLTFIDDLQNRVTERGLARGKPVEILNKEN
jgi:hypothetical protein